MAKTYTPKEVAIKILQKSEELAKSAMAGLTTTKLTPVPGVLSPTQSNTASPTKVGSQAVVKQAKAKKPAGALDKPSVFYKTEQNQQFKKSSIQSLHEFLNKKRSKKRP
jgi:hypothetical protein